MSKKGKESHQPSVTWLREPEEQDYLAAAKYLALLADDSAVRAAVQSLREAPVTHQEAKDILRASGLALLPRDNPHVASDLAKIADARKLSPVLLFAGDLLTGIPAQIADGYHRVCASYYTDENTDIPIKLARIVHLGAGHTSP